MNFIWASEREPELNEGLWQWASKQIFKDLRGFGPCTTMGVFDGPKLVAVMVYHAFDRAAGVCEMSGAALTPRWLTRKVLKEMFAYPFEQLGCQTVAMRVSAKDNRLLRILTEYGFLCYTLPRLRGRQEDENVFLLTDDKWRNNKFHQKVIGNGEKRQRAESSGSSRDGSSLDLH